MIIEYELKGSITTHKGVFDTEGFWCVFEEDKEVIDEHRFVHNGWKIYGFGSFCFFHTDFDVANEVYRMLVDVMDGCVRLEFEEIGFIRRIR